MYRLDSLTMPWPLLLLTVVPFGCGPKMVGEDSGSGAAMDTETGQASTGMGTDTGTGTGTGQTHTGTTTGTSTAGTTPWNPAPCPDGWVRPSVGSLEAGVLSVGPDDFDSSLDLATIYPKAHAHGTCLQVIGEQIAAVDVEFGPEIQGYPQSWLRIRIEHGEGSYMVERGGKDPGENVQPYTMSYTHATANPGATEPSLQTWVAGETQAFESHQLHARWVSAVAGHHLQLDNKTIIDDSPDVRPPLNLGFELDLTLPGGPELPNEAFCATVSQDDKCQRLGCKGLVPTLHITDAATCVSVPEPTCVLEADTVELGEGEARSYYNPVDPGRWVGLRPLPWDTQPLLVPKGWLACEPDDLTTPACDCSCVDAGCRAQRLRDELEACDLARPCPDLTRIWPIDQSWSNEQSCILEAFRDRTPGSYRIAVNLGDPDYDTRIHIMDDGRATMSSGHCDHSTLPGCSKYRSWSYPENCQLADVSYFSACLDGPGGDSEDTCFQDIWWGDSPWFLDCNRIAQASCN